MWCVCRRWVGNFRFTLGALYEIWRRKRYAARVAFLPVTLAAAAQVTQPGAKDSTSSPPPLTAPAADDRQRSHAAGNSVSGDDGSQSGRPESTQAGRQFHAGVGPQNGVQHGELLSELCPGGPPTPALDALGRAAELDLDSIMERHPVSASFPCVAILEKMILTLTGSQVYTEAQEEVQGNCCHARMPCFVGAVDVRSFLWRRRFSRQYCVAAGLAAVTRSGDSLLCRGQPAKAGFHLQHRAEGRL